MTLQETVKDLNEMFKQAEAEAKDKHNENKQLKDKIKELDEIVANLAKRIEYLERLVER